MNSWDEDSDERLRWQRVFTDYEVQARPALSRRILDQLPTERRRQPTRWLASAALLVLLSGGLLYVARRGDGPGSGRGKATPVKGSTPSQPVAAGGVRPPAPPTGLPLLDPLGGETVTRRQSPVHPLSGPEVADAREEVPGVDAPRVEASAGRPTPTGHLSAGQHKLLPGAPLRVQATSLFADQRPARSARSVPPRFPTGSSDPAVTVGEEPIAAPAGRSVSHRPLPDPVWSVMPPLPHAASVVWTRLKPLGVVPLAHSLNAHLGQLPVVVAAVHPAEAAVARSRPRWFIEAVPQSSFQWMRTPPASTAYLSPVSAPGAFSPATWGYQINGGIRFRRWLAHLSMGQLRRWAYYTVNENRYRVTPSPTDPHQLVRETQGVAENVALPMVGAGLSQQTLLARGRYTVELGGQVSYLPTSDQALLGLRGGAGRRLLLSQRTELQVGLTVEYGLNRLLSEQQHLVIHPLVVGIGLRIQPRSTR